jgi:hypothetical protein
MLHALGVRGVVNMCDEYAGPQSDYKRLGIQQLRLRTVDHSEVRVTSCLNHLGREIYVLLFYLCRAESKFVPQLGTTRLSYTVSNYICALSLQQC